MSNPSSTSRLQANAQRPSGFTLVELLVVIAIIGVLVALLLPAVQAAREAGRRASCLNKIRQIAIGAMNYESTYGYFPDGTDNQGVEGYAEGDPVEVTPGPDVGNCEGGPAWTVTLLPYLEQQALYDAFESTTRGFVPVLDVVCPNNNPSTGNLQQTPLDIWHCPSDPIASSPEGGHVNCYYACTGGGNPNFDNPNKDPNSICQADDCNVAARGSAWNNLHHFKNGIFYPTSKTRIAEVVDGTTNTILLGENRLHYLRGMHKSISGRTVGWSSPFLTGDQHGCSANAAAAAKAINETTNSAGVLLVTTTDTSVITSYWDSDTTFSSNHPGGAHFAMADASGQFLTEDIDIEIYRGMGRRNDGLPTSSDFAN